MEVLNISFKDEYCQATSKHLHFLMRLLTVDMLTLCANTLCRHWFSVIHRKSLSLFCLSRAMESVSNHNREWLFYDVLNQEHLVKLCKTAGLENPGFYCSTEVFFARMHQAKLSISNARSVHYTKSRAQDCIYSCVHYWHWLSYIVTQQMKHSVMTL